MKTWDVIVLGVGGMGSAACYHLARRGVKVLGVEAYQVGHDRGSSHGETRMIRQAYFEHPDYVPLILRAYELWKELETEWGKPLLHQVGVALYGEREKNKVLSAAQKSAEKYDLAFESLDSPRAKEKFPYRVPDNFLCLYEPTGGFLEVENCVRAHAHLAQKMGAVILQNERVLNWKQTGNDFELETLEEKHRTPKLILTPGAWASSLLTDLRLPLTVHRNLLFWYPHRKSFERAPCFGYETEKGFFYGFPSLPGQGLKVAFHAPGEKVVDPFRVERGLKASDLAEISWFMKEFFPALAAKPVRHAVCFYTMTPDKHFIIDQHPRFNGISYAVGFSGHGFKFCPVVGEILADLALQNGTRHPMDFLRCANRF